MSDARAYGLTRGCAALLTALRKNSGPNGVPPSYEQLAAHLGLASKSGVHRLVRQLEQRGFVRRLPGKPRSIRLIESHDWKPTIALPIWIYKGLCADAARQGLSPDRLAAEILEFCLADEESSLRAFMPSAVLSG